MPSGNICMWQDRGLTPWVSRTNLMAKSKKRKEEEEGMGRLSHEKSYTTTVTIGFLWYSQMREALTEYQAEYPSLIWKEGKGWLDRSFYISGPLPVIKLISNRFDDWSSSVREVHVSYPLGVQ